CEQFSPLANGLHRNLVHTRLLARLSPDSSPSGDRRLSAARATLWEGLTLLALRVATAVVGIPALLAALYYGGLFWLSLVVVIAFAGALESGMLFGVGSRPGRVAVAGGACAVVLWAYTSARDDVSAAEPLAVAS